MKILGLSINWPERLYQDDVPARSAVSASYSSSWADLEPDILGHCFSQLDMDEAERARIIPLVCKHWRAVEKSHPPAVPLFLISRLPVLPSQVAWFQRVAPSVEEVAVKLTRERIWGAGGLIQILEHAAIASPNLETCVLGEGGVQLASEQVCDRWTVRTAAFGLTQLKQLHLARWSFADYHPAGCKESLFNDIWLLSGLQKLEVLHLGALCIEGRDGATQGNVFWETLANLERLEEVKIKALEIPDDLSMIEDECFGNNVALCTQIKYLHLPDLHDYDILDPINRLATMTQLTRLTLRQSFPCHLLSGFLHFPALRDLDLILDLDAPGFSAPVVGSQPLTRLCLRRTEQVKGVPYDLAVILPPDAPALASLQRLELRMLTLNDLPSEVMEAMTQLTHLHLSPLALGISLGVALCPLTSLQELSISRKTAVEHHHKLQFLPFWLPSFKLLDVR